MGAGRKTQTYDVDTGAENEHARWRFESQQRLLGEALGGVIFVCNNDTYEECVKGLVFGLPQAHWCYVQNIHVGMPMFLFNYSTRQMHGIWESTTHGEWKLNPAGWTGNPDSTRTMYPCQVGVRPYSECPPLEMAEYKPIMKGAYFNSADPQFRSKFSLELTKQESINLCQAFDRKAGTGGSKRPQPVPGSASMPAPRAQRPAAPAAAAAAAPAAAKPLVEKPKAAETPSLSEADFPALGAGSSRPSAWSKKPNIPVTDEDGFEMVRGRRGGRPRPNLAAIADVAAAENHAGESAPSQSASPPLPQINTRPAADGNDTAKAPQAPSTPPAQKEFTAPSNGPTTATSASAPPPATSSPVSGSSAPDTTPALAAVHAAVSALDVAAADAVHHCFSVMTSHMQRLQRDQTALAQALHASQADNGILQRELQRMRLEMAQLGQATGVSISAEAPELQNLSSMRSREAILMLGGHDGQQWTTVMHLFNPGLNTVREFDHVPFAQGYGGTVLLGRSIYVIGGGDGLNWNKTAYNFDLDSKDWFQVADMDQERGSLGVAEVGGLIYACGGGRGGQSSVNLDSVEVFTPEHNTWTWGPKMHEQRFTTSAAAINGAIYITGGFDGGAYLPTAERLDPRVGAWQPVPLMPHKRGSHVSAVVGDSLYVMGGWDSKKYLDHLEVFDTRAGRWRTAPHMATPRAYGSAAVLNDQIYIIGGLSGSAHATTVERYSPNLDKWEQVCADTPISQAFMSAVVVEV